MDTLYINGLFYGGSQTNYICDSGVIELLGATPQRNSGVMESGQQNKECPSLLIPSIIIIIILTVLSVIPHCIHIVVVVTLPPPFKLIFFLLILCTFISFTR